MKKFGLDEQLRSGELTCWQRVKPRVWGCVVCVVEGPAEGLGAVCVWWRSSQGSGCCVRVVECQAKGLGVLCEWQRVKPRVWALFDEPYSSTAAKVSVSVFHDLLCSCIHRQSH